MSKRAKVIFAAFILSFSSEKINILSQTEQLDVYSLLAEAKKYYQFGDYKLMADNSTKAISIIKGATSIENKTNLLAEAYFYLGISFLKKNDIRNMKVYFSISIDYDPQYKVDYDYFNAEILNRYDDVRREKGVQQTTQNLQYNNVGNQKKMPIQLNEGEVRVIKEGALLKVLPNDSSLTIRLLKPGSLLTWIGTLGA